MSGRAFHLLVVRLRWTLRPNARIMPTMWQALEIEVGKIQIGVTGSVAALRLDSASRIRFRVDSRPARRTIHLRTVIGLRTEGETA